jgi:hypothetical protein
MVAKDLTPIPAEALTTICAKSGSFMQQFRIARRLHSERAYSRAAARNFVNDRQGYRTVKGCGRISLVRDPDPRMARLAARDRREQSRGMRRVQPDTVMRGRPAKPRQL